MPAGEPVTVDVDLQAVNDAIVVKGHVRAPWAGECRRCLDRVEGRVEVEVQEVFEPRPAPDAETYRLDGDQLALEPMVRDAVLLALPLAPLCREGCAGPDPDDHPVGTADDATEPAPDERWSALKELKFD